MLNEPDQFSRLPVIEFEDERQRAVLSVVMNEGNQRIQNFEVGDDHDHRISGPPVKVGYERAGEFRPRL